MSGIVIKDRQGVGVSGAEHLRHIRAVLERHRPACRGGADLPDLPRGGDLEGGDSELMHYIVVVGSSSASETIGHSGIVRYAESGHRLVSSQGDDGDVVTGYRDGGC